MRPGAELQTKPGPRHKPSGLKIGADDRQPRSKLLGLDRTTALVVLLIIAAASLFCAVWWGTSPLVDTDTYEHMRVAAEIRSGRFDTVQFAAPGYAVILLATGSDLTPGPTLFLAQVVAHAIAVWLIVLLAQRFGLPRLWTILLAALSMSLPLTEKVSWALTEAFAEFFVVVSLYLVVRWWEDGKLIRLFGASLSAVAGALVRPSLTAYGLLLAAAVGYGVWRRRHSAARALSISMLMATMVVVLIGGVVVFNGQSRGYYGLTPLAGWQLTTRTATFLDDAPPTFEPLRSAVIRARDEDVLVPGSEHAISKNVWRHHDQVERETGMNAIEVDRALTKMNASLILRNPIQYAHAVLSAVPTYLFPSLTLHGARDNALVLLLHEIGHVVIAIAFVVQLWGVSCLRMGRRLGAQFRLILDRRGARATYTLSLAAVLYSLAVSTMFEAGSQRYRTSTDLLILLLTVGGIWTLRVGIRSNSALRSGIEACG